MTIDLPHIKSKLNKRVLLGCGLFILFCFVSFNLKYIYYDSNYHLSLDESSLSNDNTHKYLVVIGSDVKYQSRRNLIRSSYFGIEDNLVPIDSKNLQQVQYAFCVHGEPPASNTVEKRNFETEKMEYNDIVEMDTMIEYNQKNLLDWIYATLLKEKKMDDIDYIIIQDIHSFIPLDKLIQTIESKNGDTTIHWGQNEKGLVIGSTAFQDLLLGEKDLEFGSPLPSQVWENSIESTHVGDDILITNVYQDQDFIVLQEAYGSKPVHLSKSVANKVVVTSSYIYDRCMEPSGTRASLNKRDYADKQGYAFVARSREFAQQAIRPDQRRTVWGKIDVIRKVLPKYEWLFWLDMDAVVMNENQSLESLLQRLKTDYYQGTPEEFDQNIDFIIVRPGTDKMINAGVFLIKNTAWSFDFLRDIQTRVEWYKQGPSYEQGAMWDVMRQEKYMSRTLFLDRENHIFNTFPKFYEDDFIVHFAPDKCPNSATLKGLAAADKIKQGKKITSSQLL